MDLDVGDRKASYNRNALGSLETLGAISVAVRDGDGVAVAEHGRHGVSVVRYVSWSWCGTRAAQKPLEW